MKTSNFVVALGSLVMVAGAFALATPASGYSSPECRVNCSGEPTPPQSSLIISQEETENEGEGAPAQIDPGEETGFKGGYTIPQRLIEQSLAQSQDPEVPVGDPKRTGNAGPRYAPPQRRA